MSAAPLRPPTHPPPAAATALGAGARPGAAGAGGAAKGVVATDGPDHSREATGGARRARRSGSEGAGAGDGWEEPRTRGLLSTPPRGGMATGGRGQPRGVRFSRLTTGEGALAFPAPLPVCFGPALGSFRSRQTEDLATRAPGRCPLLRRCERALARSPAFVPPAAPARAPGAPVLLQSSPLMYYHQAERAVWSP